MQSVSSRIWTRVAVSISYDDNHYTTGSSIHPVPLSWHSLVWECCITPEQLPKYFMTKYRKLVSRMIHDYITSELNNYDELTTFGRCATLTYYTQNWRNTRSVLAKVLDWDILVTEFKLQSRDYVHFWINTLWKVINPCILYSYGLNCIAIDLPWEWLSYSITH